MKILVIDIGGSNIKLRATGQERATKIASGASLSAKQLVQRVEPIVADWKFENISIGCPAPIINGHIITEPKNLGPGWLNFDFAGAFGKPVRLINDAAMQALGSYQGGRMLFLGLGTGLGSALVLDGLVVPLELAHLPYKKGQTFEDFVGRRGLRKLGKRKWQRAVIDVTNQLRAALVVEEVVIGGGNVKLLDKIPSFTRRGSNRNAFEGGLRLWKTK